MLFNKKISYLAFAVVILSGASQTTLAASSSADLWKGFYAGVQVGRDSGETNMRWSPVNNDGPVDITGFGGGVSLGYNVRFNSFVLGLEGDIETSTLNGDDNARGGLLNEFEGNWMGSLRLRAGYSFDRTLFYVTGGYAWMDADGKDLTLGGTASYSLKGTTFGAGVEYAFTDRLSGRLEYRHTNFDTERETYPAGYYLDFDPEIDSVRIGMNYRF